jgi:hypothetical protein
VGGGKPAAHRRTGRVDLGLGFLRERRHYRVTGRAPDPEGVSSRPHERISPISSPAAAALVARIPHAWGVDITRVR